MVRSLSFMRLTFAGERRGVRVERSKNPHEVDSGESSLFERLREANILLQEVLSGAHENMSAIEGTLVTRVSEFVSTMNEVSERAGVTSGQVDQHISQFNTITNKALVDLGQLATQFDSYGRALAEAVAMIDKSNRRTEETVGDRRASIENLVSSLDSRTDDIEQRLKRFSALLDESLDGATGRAREIARRMKRAASPLLPPSFPSASPAAPASSAIASSSASRRNAATPSSTA